MWRHSEPIGSRLEIFSNSRPLALAVLEIGLRRIREECPHFDDWVHTLESLVG